MLGPLLQHKDEEVAYWRAEAAAAAERTAAEAEPPRAARHADWSARGAVLEAELAQAQQLHIAASRRASHLEQHHAQLKHALGGQTALAGGGPSPSSPASVAAAARVAPTPLPHAKPRGGTFATASARVQPAVGTTSTAAAVLDAVASARELRERNELLKARLVSMSR